MKHVLPMKPVPKWVALGFIPIVLVLTVVLFEVVSSFFQANDQMAYLSVVSGVVTVSDGITEITAVNGDLSVRNVRTLLKTGQGIANLTFWDGSVVIVDSDSTIEINRQIATDSGKSFAFNLVKGNALVVNEEGSQTPIQIIIGGDIAVQVFRGALGLEVTSDSAIRERVDCLVGQCLVNGVYHLNTGQNAQIGPGNNIQVTESVPYTKWISLVKASKPGPVLSNLFENLPPTITQSTSSPDPLQKTKSATSIIVTSTLTSLPSSTPTPIPSETITYTSTITPSPSSTSSRTATFTKTAPSPTATRTITWNPIPWYTFTPTRTPMPSATPLPTYTNTPTPTSTQTNTNTPQPTFTLTYTSTLQPTFTLTYTSTLQPTPIPQPTPTLTRTTKPTPTPKHQPSSTPTPTNEPLPTPTNTLAPTATDTPISTDTPIPTELPTPTDTPVVILTLAPASSNP